MLAEASVESVALCMAVTATVIVVVATVTFFRRRCAPRPRLRSASPACGTGRPRLRLAEEGRIMSIPRGYLQEQIWARLMQGKAVRYPGDRHPSYRSSFANIIK